MKMIVRLSAVALCCCIGSVHAQSSEKPAEAAAEAPPAASPLTANVTLASQYVSRGFRQTWGKPALQAGVDYAHPSGFSIGAWASNVSKHYIEDSSVEVDLYGGYTGAVGDFGYSVLGYYYKYPGARISATGTKFDYGELSLGVTYKFLSAKYNRTVTRDFFGITDARGTGYWDISANPELGAGYTLNLHYGMARLASKGAADNSVWNWRDYKVGVSKAFDGGWTLAGAFTRAVGATGIYNQYSTGMPGAAVSNPSRGTVVVSLNKVF